MLLISRPLAVSVRDHRSEMRKILFASAFLLVCNESELLRDKQVLLLRVLFFCKTKAVMSKVLRVTGNRRVCYATFVEPTNICRLFRKWAGKSGPRLDSHFDVLVLFSLQKVQARLTPRRFYLFAADFSRSYRATE